MRTQQPRAASKPAPKMEFAGVGAVAVTAEDEEEEGELPDEGNGFSERVFNKDTMVEMIQLRAD